MNPHHFLKQNSTNDLKIFYDTKQKEEKKATFFPPTNKYESISFTKKTRK